MSEVIVAEHGERQAAQPHTAPGACENFTNSGERNSAKRSGYARSGTDREKQFVIFTTVQPLFDGGAGKQRERMDVRRDTGGFTQTRKIDGEAVAEIHGGGGVKTLP